MCRPGCCLFVCCCFFFFLLFFFFFFVFFFSFFFFFFGFVGNSCITCSTASVKWNVAALIRLFRYILTSSEEVPSDMCAQRRCAVWSESSLGAFWDSLGYNVSSCVAKNVKFLRANNVDWFDGTPGAYARRYVFSCGRHIFLLSLHFAQMMPC